MPALTPLFHGEFALNTKHTVPSLLCVQQRKNTKTALGDEGGFFYGMRAVAHNKFFAYLAAAWAEWQGWQPRKVGYLLASFL